MKSKINIVSFFAFIFVSTTSFAQYKYDIGLRVSTLETQRVNLDFRYHLKSPYSLLFSIGYGKEASGNGFQSPLYNGDLINSVQSLYNMLSSSAKIGIQRKLDFLPTDVFYAGATVGFGYENRTFRRYFDVYSVDASVDNYLNPVVGDWEIQFSDEYVTVSRNIVSELTLLFGLDIPLSKRFSINAEIGANLTYHKELNSTRSSLSPFGYASGGLRYSFGKRHRGAPSIPN